MRVNLARGLAATLLLAGLATQPVAAAELRILLTPESGITVGDPVQVVLEARLDAGERIADTDWTRTWFPEDSEAVELTSVGTPQLDHTGGVAIWRQLLTLRVFRPGEVKLPAPPLSVVTDGSEQPAAMEPISFRVDSVLPTEGEIDPAPPAPVRPRPLGAAFWTLASLLAATVIGSGLLAVGAGGFASEQARRAMQDPLAELRHALQRLDPRQPDRGHVGLSWSLRRFLERRTGSLALERTTTEIYADLTRLEVADNSRREVRTILADCDMVKFGGAVSSRQDLGERVKRTQSVAEEIAALLAARELAEAEHAAGAESPHPPRSGGGAS